MYVYELAVDPSLFLRQELEYCLAGHGDMQVAGTPYKGSINMVFFFLCKGNEAVRIEVPGNQFKLFIFHFLYLTAVLESQ